MSVNVTDRVRELLEQLDHLMREYANLVGAANSLPTVALVNLLKKIANVIALLSNVPAKVWLALFFFVRCDNRLVAALAVHELKQLLEVLKAFAELELEALDGDDPETREQREALQAWLKELCEKIDNWVDDQAHDQALAIVVGLKNWLRAHWPQILANLVLLFGDDVLDLIKNLATGPGAIKFLIKKLIQKLLERIGTQAAKALIPAVGAILALAELIALLVILAELDDLQEMIDAILAQLILELVAAGADWNCFDYIWFSGDVYCDAKVTKKPQLKCGKKNEDGVWVFGDECSVPFADGETSKTVCLEKKPPMYDSDKGVWKCPYDVEDADIENASCAEGAELCLFFIDVTVTDKNGKTTQSRFIAGAKKLD